MSFFAAALASAIVTIISLNTKEGFGGLEAVWLAYVTAPEESKTALAVFVVSVTYFTGGLYLNSVHSSSFSGAIETPASIDQAVNFELPPSIPESDQELFISAFERLKNEIVEDLPSVYEMPPTAVAWIDHMIGYTVAGGKMNRGLATMACIKSIATSQCRVLSNRERVQSAALGWCIEWLQAFFLVADDVMDASVTRRGEPCWYRRSNVQLIAINDSFILESCVYKILKRYFGREAYYTQLVDLFIEVSRQTELGQLLDLTSQPQDGIIDLERFTMERYTSIVKYKTAFYSFYLPVALGMIVAGVSDPKIYEQTREILCAMGEYFQIQDDFLDCYGDPKVIGKVGTDIQDNKCSWLVIQALKRCTLKQRKVLEKNYGQQDLAKVNKVKELYNELNLATVFKKYEDESYQHIQLLMDESKDLPEECFAFLLNKIYKRKL